MSLYSDFFYSNHINELFSDRNEVARMLEVESALAQAQAQEGLFSEDLALAISKCCSADFIDINLLKSEIKLGGNAAIPLVKQLTRQVKIQNFEASKYVHFGATSQDIIDTATVLGIKEYLNFIESSIEHLIENLVHLVKKHRETAMIGRTLLQQAKPITFGLKLIGWLSGLEQSHEHLYQLRNRVLKIQLGGAVGGGNASITEDVKIETAILLGLHISVSWQSSRGSFGEWASFLGVLSGNLGKIAKDISLLMQTEIGEVFEGAAEGKGGSSTMPHKRNPVTCAAILANANRVPHLVASMLSSMIQEHERSAGLWHSEWETLKDLMSLTAGSLEKSIELLEHLEVNETQMAKNLELTKGLIYAENVSLALGKEIGKIQAHEYIEKACKKAIAKDMHLLDVLKEQSLDLNNLASYFSATFSLDATYKAIDKVLEKYS
jgi:3-carboxy-cis,cis-muconate cycloisomerase